MSRNIFKVVISMLLIVILLVISVGCTGTTTSTATTSAITNSATTTKTTNTISTSTTTTNAATVTTTTTSGITKLPDGRIGVPSEVFAPSNPPTFKFDRTFTWYPITPLSGTGTIYGVAQTRGEQFAADDINAQGGIVVDGIRYKIALQTLDNAYDSVKTVQVTQQAVEQYNTKYVAVIGTGPNQAVEDYLAQRNIFNLADMGILPSTIGNKWPLQFGDQVINIIGNITNYYPYFIDNGAKTSVICTSDNDTGRTYVNLTHNICTSNNYQIKFFTDQYFIPGTQDFSPLVNKIISLNPDIVDGAGAAVGDIALLAKQLRGAGYKGIITELTVSLDPAVLWQVGGASSTGIITIGWNGLSETPTPLYDSFAARYKAKYNEDAYYQAYFLYEHAYYLWEAIGIANTFDVYKVADTYSNLEWNGLYGNTKWTGDEPGSFGIRRVCTVPTPLITATTQGKANVLAMPSDGSNGKPYRITSTIK